jgi:hypothetical protein
MGHAEKKESPDEKEPRAEEGRIDDTPGKGR